MLDTVRCDLRRKIRAAELGKQRRQPPVSAQPTTHQYSEVSIVREKSCHQTQLLDMTSNVGGIGVEELRR